MVGGGGLSRRARVADLLGNLAEKHRLAVTAVQVFELQLAAGSFVIAEQYGPAGAAFASALELFAEARTAEINVNGMSDQPQLASHWHGESFCCLSLTNHHHIRLLPLVRLLA